MTTKEGSLEAPTRHPIDWKNPEYYDVTPVRRLDDGSQEVSLHVGDPQWLERLLLRLAPHAQVVGPQEFADTFRARARAALRLYE